MISCTRCIEFDAAHRIIGHENKCRLLHGHRYKIEASFTCDALDHLGRIVDFSKIYQHLGQWLNDNWDHNTILYKHDKELGESISKITGQNIFYLPDNPTAENMAYYVMTNVIPILFNTQNITCTKIRLYETPNCYAEITT